MAQHIFLKVHRLFLICAISFSTVGCDQVTKVLARDTLAMNTLSYLGDSIRLQHAENSGAFMSIGADLPEGLRFAIFTFSVALLLLVAAWYLFKDESKSTWKTVAITLILAGGTGNLIDRAFRGSVTDFLNVGVGWLRTGIFNVADMAVVAGVLIMLFVSFKSAAQVAGSQD